MATQFDARALALKSRSPDPGMQAYVGCNKAPSSSQNGFIPQLVTAQAAIHPDVCALATSNELLTYLDLDKRSDRVAHYLRSLRVGPETLVGSCFERSIGAVVAALAILKAGGAYLPLDPAYPEARLTYQLKDSRVAVLLTQEKIAERFHGGEWRVVSLSEAEAGAGSDSTEGVNAVVAGDDLAYVIYTSGSTGRPKGVEITHKALLNLVCWHQRAFEVNSNDRASQLSSPGFDAAVWELWPYVTAGARVYIPDENLRYEPEALRDWLVANRITMAFAATPVAERMINLPWPSETALRVLLTGGDTLHAYPPLNLPFQLVNNYGPTECTVVASSGTVLPNECPDVPPSIGYPIANTQIYILDEQMQQVPTGAVGEMHIAGAGLARGYVNHPELTAERFVPNPYSSDFNARLYKTGDFASYLPDGQISFVGRTDEQIKIRGYRIELNEITTVLSAHPMVEGSLVLAREDTAGDKRLVAYIVAKSGTQLTGRDLRQFLSAHLPGFMVPDVFVRLDSIPVNANGKIDRLALPAPTEANTVRGETSVCGSTPTQQVLASILRGLLRLEQVGVSDNFFLLGGNSLLGAQVIAKVRETFAVELSLLSLFDNPTILELSSEIERLLLIKVNALTENEVRLLTATGASESL